ncbi:MAG TPA: hypothetical protein VF170_08975 [Planctomycetaceae bacterium]
MTTQLETPPLRLGPDDAGRRVSAAEFRAAEFEEGFLSERLLSETDEYATPLLPGLTVPRAEAFAEFGGR